VNSTGDGINAIVVPQQQGSGIVILATAPDLDACCAIPTKLRD
jgi:hypothetical protein